MYKRLQPYFPALFALFAGALLPLAFAPFGFYPLAVISPALLLITWLNCNAKQAFWRGFAFGFGFFAVGVSWVFVSIHQFGQSNITVALLLTVLMVIIMGLFPAATGYVLNKYWRHNSPAKLLLAFPACWVIFEWLRGSWAYFLKGFPWLLVGFSQTNSPLRGLAPIIGVYGLSFLCVFTAGVLVLGGLRWRQQRHIHSLSYIISIIIVWVAVYPLHDMQWTKQQGKAVSVSLIQGNIPQSIKWSPKALRKTLETYQDLTDQHWNSQLIIWPEGAIAAPTAYMQNYLFALSDEARKHHVTLITGIPAEANEPGRYYNAMLALGDGSGIYYKRHLVPFGEYVPLEHMLRGIFKVFDLPMSSLIPGPKEQPNLFSNDQQLQIAPFICYEIAYPDIVLDDLPAANLLVTISDDAWFGDSLAPAQHLQIAQMRSLQTGRYQLAVTNDGITAIINPQGYVVKKIVQFKQAVLTGEVFAMVGSTPWVRIGYLPIIFLMFVLLALAFVFRRRR